MIVVVDETARLPMRVITSPGSSACPVGGAVGDDPADDRPGHVGEAGCRLDEDAEERGRADVHRGRASSGLDLPLDRECLRDRDRVALARAGL